MTEKLAKYMARCGVASRRHSEEIIRAGWVRVNGIVVSTPETRIDPAQAQVEVQGKVITPLEIFQYLMLNKPTGYLCTFNPGREKGKTLGDLIRVPERLYPAGRLDRDTSGLLLLTNDGEFVQRLIHPSFQQEREYLIQIHRAIIPLDLVKLRAGIKLDDGLSKFKAVEQMGERSLRVILTEGRKRQIRRTLDKLGMPILSLQRVRFGSLQLADLAEGRWRELLANEIIQLKT
jgi:23S rRNA pseudouridine2605 synthase